jgi:hypothetical protein
MHASGRAPHIEVTLQSTIEVPWTEVPVLCVGAVPPGQGTPDLYVTLQVDGRLRLRADVYGTPGNEGFPFQDAAAWQGRVVIGFGHRVHAVCPQSLEVRMLELGSYFGSFHLCEERLLVASAERVYCLDAEGILAWTSDPVGVDGVVNHRVADGRIEGAGDWDPPGGWVPFTLVLASGR